MNGRRREEFLLIDDRTKRFSPESIIFYVDIQPIKLSRWSNVGLGSWSCKNDSRRRGWFRGTIVEDRGLAVVGPEERARSGCAVLACRTPKMSVTAARPQALIATISNLLPTMFMTRVRL
jgi:hypothetical protein